MPGLWKYLLFFSALSSVAAAAQSSPPGHNRRQQASDLEVSGELANLPAGSTRYVTRAELAAMPQTVFTATGDPNFTRPVQIRGVKLEELARRLSASPSSTMVVAVCDDLYLSAYPRDYLAAHHPVLVLEVDGQPPDRWPKAADDHTSSMGPYMISNPAFAPAFKVLSHSDEAQIPWGVVRLEFRDEKAVLGAIAPRGPRAKETAVQDGYRIAAQNCFRCHNEGSEGGQKSGRPWDLLGGRAAASPKEFSAYVRSPAARNPGAQMPGNPAYDDSTLAALTAYFRTFAPGAKP